MNKIYMCIGKKINDFERLPEQTLRSFNELFTQCPLDGAEQSEVEIGEIIGPANVRKVVVGGVELTHSFQTEPPRLFGDAEDFIGEDGKLLTNSSLENTLMDERDMKLDATEYMLLQYLRGCQSPYHTQQEIADKLGKSIRGIRNALKSMEEQGMITSINYANLHRMKITVNRDWA